MKARGVSAVSLVGSAFFAFSACSNSKSDPGPGDQLGVGGSSTASGGTGASAGNAVGSGGAGGPGTVIVGSGGSGGGGGGGGADFCAGTDVPSDLVPPILQFVVDTSGSMDWPPGFDGRNGDPKPPGPTKWELTRDALKKAFEAMSPVVGTGVMPYPLGGSTTDTEQLCKSKAVVPLATLDGPGSLQRKLLEDWLMTVLPAGGTPTHGALHAGIEAVAATALKGNRFVVLITDGVPTVTIDCQVNGDGFPPEPIVEEARSAAPGVRTFVIGSPGSEAYTDGLSRIAEAGGTGKPGCQHGGPNNFCHFDLTKNLNDFSEALNKALTEIMEGVLSCELPVPPHPDPRTQLDYERVNVVVKKGDGAEETIKKDPSKDQCNVGWQYNLDRSKIIVCPTTCEELKQKHRSDPKARLAVRFDCKTVIH